ncbi:MAG TPA: UvrD-helicase domain-containing protein [Myxococcales bacterium]
MSEAPTIPAELASHPLLVGLNPPQQAAVVHGEGPLLVLAGAGSGKTRVITHRVAWLVQERNVVPWHILAVTFTNKAAGEMRERLVKLLGPLAADLHVSTFHATGAAILRREAEKVGLTRSFVIYDDSDQLTLLKRALKECGVGDRIKVQLVRHRIDQAKNLAQGPADMFVGAADFVGQGVRKAYFAYEKLLRQADAVDFGDLLLKVVELFRKDPETLARYRRRFQYLMVDEFQDTNPVQYELLRLLTPSDRPNLCVVGDDDQSIYRWRGADVTNILSFEKDFPGTATVKLERNYRSDAGILEAAYAVISKNLRRKEKRLWTDRPRGLPLSLILAPDERAEAQQVARHIKELQREELPLSEIAVFYRVNAQSRVIEEGMRLAGVPYRVVRGRAFYDRAEIKNAASYLRLAVNPKSDTDLERVINTPARGIGDTTVERLRAHAAANGTNLFEALADPSRIDGLNAGAQRRLAAFRDLVATMHRDVVGAPDAHAAVQKMLDVSGLLDSHAADDSEEGQERAENLREFAGAALQFDELRAAEKAGPAAQPAAIPAASPPPAIDQASEEGPLRPNQSALEAFLEQISLLGDADAEGTGGQVSLMTLHAAKGLEFDAVFLTGMEEGIFPHSRATAGTDAGWDPEEMAEERRLCYVGITRARKRLTFSLARMRALFGDLQQNAPSRFLSDVPKELFGFEGGGPSQVREDEPGFAEEDEERVPGDTYVERDEAPAFELDAADGFDEFDQRPAHERRAHPTGTPMRRHPMKPAPRLPGPSFPVGARVRHDSLGEGLVVSTSGEGPNARITVRFPGEDERRIVARFLRLA